MTADHGPGVPAPKVRLLGLATAVPPHPLPQAEVIARLPRLFPGAAALAGIGARAGIDMRYGVCPLDWFDRPRTVAERAARYLEGATDLFVEVATAALADAAVGPECVDAVVTVSSTGIATPTLEARACGRLGFRSDVQRVPVFGLGCAGGVTGLALARRLAAARPGSRVLLVAVETCTLAFRDDRPGKADLVATLLFGDGAAAALVASTDDAPVGAAVVGDGVEHLWPDSLDVMGWEVDDQGLGVIFDRSIPALVLADMREILDTGLARLGLTRADVRHLAFHPGGTRVLEALEASLGLDAGTLRHERAVLRAYGNMSSPTALFVLARLLAERARGPAVLSALGPGFTASMLALHLEG